MSPKALKLRRCLEGLDYITMGYPGSSRSSCQLKSVLLRTNEEFVRLYNDVTEARRLSFERSHVLDDQDFGGLWDLTQFARTTDHDWKQFQDKIRDADQRIKRVEMNALFSETVLAGIMLQFEEKIFPVLREFRLCYEGQNIFLYNLETDFLLINEKYALKALLEAFAECVSSGLESAHKVVVSALDLLSFVYQYLIGCVDKGGSKTYSPGSFLFRLIFVAIVLFLGSYVWIKFRQASYTASRRKRKSCPLADRASRLGDESEVPAGVYRRAVKDARGSVTYYRYEPRFKPRREKLESGASRQFNCLSLGSYATLNEAEIVRHIAAVLYGEEEGCPVQFEDGLSLPFPSVTEGENCLPSGKEKAVWVTHKTKDLYAELLEEKARRQLLQPAVEIGSHDGHAGEVHLSDPSPSAPVAPSTAIELTCFTLPHGGNGVVGQPTTCESHDLGQEAHLAREVFPANFSDSDFNQFISSMLQSEDNDFPAVDQIEGDCSETDPVLGFESTVVSPQSSALDIPTIVNFGSLPQLGVGDQGLEIVEPHLNLATAITIHHLESLPEQVQLQQRVTYREQRPEEFLRSNVELQQKLLESEERISELEQKLLQSEVENEKWRSMFHQLSKLISASDEDGSPVDVQ